jgi:hypothetical protein
MRLPEAEVPKLEMQMRETNLLLSRLQAQEILNTKFQIPPEMDIPNGDHTLVNDEKWWIQKERERRLQVEEIRNLSKLLKEERFGKERERLESWSQSPVRAIWGKSTQQRILTLLGRYQNGKQSIGQESYQEKGMTQYAPFRNLILREDITCDDVLPFYSFLRWTQKSWKENKKDVTDIPSQHRVTQQILSH